MTQAAEPSKPPGTSTSTSRYSRDNVSCGIYVCSTHLVMVSLCRLKEDTRSCRHTVLPENTCSRRPAGSSRHTGTLVYERDILPAHRATCHQVQPHHAAAVRTLRVKQALKWVMEQNCSAALLCGYPPGGKRRCTALISIASSTDALRSSQTHSPNLQHQRRRPQQHALVCYCACLLAKGVT